MPTHSTERLFFALWPNDIIRSEINQLNTTVTQKRSGQRTKIENLHITLVFLGHVDLATKAKIQHIAATVQNERFVLTLDTLGYWPKPRIVWLGSRQTPLALQNLVSHLTYRLQQEVDYSPENRPYHPHVTLMRKAAPLKTLPAFSPIHWQINDFSLVRSITERHGVCYQVIDRWQLH